MACGQSQIGIIGTNHAINKNGTVTRISNLTTSFEGYTMNASHVVNTADKLSSLDGSPETFGGGGDTWHTIKFNGSGGPAVTLTANQYVWAKSSALGSYTIHRASTLTTSYYIAMIDFAGSPTNVLPVVVYSNVSSGSPTGDAYHPIFTSNNQYFVTEANDDQQFMAITECASP